MNTHRLRITAATLLGASLLLLIATYPLAQTLPGWWGYENQPIENTQVAVLAGGLMVAALFSYRSTSAGKWFGLAAVPIYLIIIGRELSWGAVFLEPTSIGEHGPLFASRGLWYKPIVAPVVTGLIVLCVAVVAFTPLAKSGIRLLRDRRVPIWSLVVTAVAMAVSTAAEGHLPLMPLNDFLDGHVAQLLEELAELSAYLATVAGMMFIMADLEDQWT